MIYLWFGPTAKAIPDLGPHCFESKFGFLQVKYAFLSLNYIE
jgi:hypothetical protein